MSGLAIREVAEQSGVAAGTIRMWEQRYGFPEPERTASGYRRYTPADVETLRRVVELRRGGMSVPAALERARAFLTSTEHPSIFGAIPHQGRSRRLRKRTLVALSRAIEDETMASASRPVVLGAFQRARHYRRVEHRYRRIAQSADVVATFADFEVATDAACDPVEVPISLDEAIGHEWAVVVDAPGFSVCLAAWEPPVPEPPQDEYDRVFEAFWTLDASVVREAAHAGAQIARVGSPAVADRIEALLLDRPVGAESSSAALEALTARMVAYLEP
jgi:DICT domain-containing protein